MRGRKSSPGHILLSSLSVCSFASNRRPSLKKQTFSPQAQRCPARDKKEMRKIRPRKQEARKTLTTLTLLKVVPTHCNLPEVTLSCSRMRPAESSNFVPLKLSCRHLTSKQCLA